MCLLAERIRRNAAERALGDEASQQVADATRYIDLRYDDFLHWPWGALDSLVGGMAPGTLHFVICPSKGGKTTLCRSAAHRWIRQGKRVYYAGLEMKATTLRTMYAADDCGVDPGDVLSGKWLTFAHHGELRERMVEAYREQESESSAYQRLRFSGFGAVNRKAVVEMMEMAHDWGAGVIIIDHIDHIRGSEKGQNEFSVSLATSHLLLELAQKFDLTVIATSQVNGSGRVQDRYRDHKPVLIDSVKFGNHKLEVATTMTGLYRPLKPDFRKEDRQLVDLGHRSVWDFVWPEVNAFNIMASRTYGSHIGKRGLLGWERGRIVDAPSSVSAAQEAAQHGIRTNRSY